MPNNKCLLVTGGAGFIGSAFIRYGLSKISACERIVNLDLLTYAGNLKNLTPVEKDPRYFFVHGDINDYQLVEKLCVEHAVQTIVHFAAESHVDRSIDAPMRFFDTNVRGTLNLLEVVRRHPHLHFHHISTDEVYGSLSEEGYFNENTPYSPRSPYSASKAASDHFVRSYAHTYGLSVTLSHCSNNYGPCQYPEKFIPRILINCMKKQPLPVYGKGINVRDWLYVDDHARAIWMILEQGKASEIYDIGGGCEKRNIDLLDLLIEKYAHLTGVNPERYRSLVQFIPDRPGHDLRYAIDSSKIQRELGWKPLHRIEDGLGKTIHWYIEHAENWFNL